MRQFHNSPAALFILANCCYCVCVFNPPSWTNRWMGSTRERMQNTWLPVWSFNHHDWIIAICVNHRDIDDVVWLIRHRRTMQWCCIDRWAIGWRADMRICACNRITHHSKNHNWRCARRALAGFATEWLGTLCVWHAPSGTIMRNV